MYDQSDKMKTIDGLNLEFQSLYEYNWMGQGYEDRTRIERSIVSNAEEKSSKASTDMLPLLRESNRSSTTFRRAASVLCPGGYAD